MEKITNQVEKLFSDKNQWDAFLELVPVKDTIRDDWISKLCSPLVQIFNVDDFVDGWDFYPVAGDFRWYLKDFGNDSLYLSLSENVFSLYANVDVLEKESIIQKLRSNKEYGLILSAFERLDYCLEDDDDGYLLKEVGNFSFGCLHDNYLDFDSLAWFANYKNMEFVSQIHGKIDKFRKNQEITELFVKLNKLTTKSIKKK
jgi:hypothetical protein